MPTNLSKRWVNTDGSAVSSAFLSTSPVSLPFDSQNAPQAIENPGYEYALSSPLNKRARTVSSGSTDDLSSPQSSSLPSSRTPKRDKAQARKVQRSAGGRAQRAQDKQHLGTQDVYDSSLDSLPQAPSSIPELLSTIKVMAAQLHSQNLTIQILREESTRQEKRIVQLNWESRVAQELVSKKQERIDTLERRVDMYQARERRAECRPLPKLIVPLREDGMIPMNVRLCIMDLVSLGVPFSKINRVIVKCIEELTPYEVRGSFHRSSVSRIVLEGFAAAQHQIVHETLMSSSE
jgi:hypothetical protein